MFACCSEWPGEGTQLNVTVLGQGGASTADLWRACERSDMLSAGFYDFTIIIRNINEAFNKQCVIIGERPENEETLR